MRLCTEIKHISFTKAGIVFYTKILPLLKKALVTINYEKLRVYLGKRDEEEQPVCLLCSCAFTEALLLTTSGDRMVG